MEKTGSKYKVAFLVVTIIIMIAGGNQAEAAGSATGNTAGAARNDTDAGFAAGGQGMDNTYNQLVEEQIETSGVDAINEGLIKYAKDESLELFEGLEPDELVKSLAEGKAAVDLGITGRNLLNFLFKEIGANAGLLIRLSALAAICAILKNLRPGIMEESAGQAAFFACYAIAVAMLLAGFGTVIELSVGIIGSLVGFMYAIIPVLFALLVSGGNLAAGGILHPVLLIVVEVSATVIKNLFLPLVFLSTILSIVNNISEKIQLARMASLVKQIVSWATGILMTCFVAAIILQGTLGAVIDGATSKAAKFAISTFIPIVGKTLADAADTVIGCALMVKNASGAAAVIGIIAICAAPMLKILALAALFKAAGALLEPISESRIANCINDVAGSIIQVFALTTAVAAMFIVMVAALVSAGNTSAMLR